MVLPTDIISIFGTAFSRFVLGVAVDTPYSKMLETEADEVGLDFAAKACFDVREASAFWYKMAIIQKEASGMVPTKISENIEFLASHPSHEKRCEHLDSLLDKAIQCRLENGCKPLSNIDPRKRVKDLQNKIVEEYKQKSRDGVLKIGDL